MSWESIVATVGVALIAAMPGILSFLNQRRKDTVEITDVSQRAAISMIQALQDRVNRLDDKISKLEIELEKKETEIDVLRRDLVEKDGQIVRLKARVAELEKGGQP